jgi:hypothetical protein
MTASDRNDAKPFVESSLFRSAATQAAQSAAATRPVALFVLGMSRSGTSALTRVLSLSGGVLPAGMMGADSGNPSGYWEPRASLRLNYGIMRRHDSSWLDPTLRLQEEGAFDAKEAAACIAKIEAFLTTLPAAPLVVIKDLQITALSGMWFEAARLAGFGIAAVIAVRHPLEVIASLSEVNGTSLELASALWLRANLLAERHTRAVPRVFVEYANLLKDWRREIERISAAVEIDLNTRDERAIDEFLAPDLYRQQCSGPAIERFGADWISAVHQVLVAAASDEPWNASVLDRVFEAYRASEHDFRTAFEDFHKLQRVYRLTRPSIVKLIYEALALVHRRRGTWA